MDSSNIKTVEPELKRLAPTRFTVTNFENIAISLHRSVHQLSEFFGSELKCDVALNESALLIKTKVSN